MTSPPLRELIDAWEALSLRPDSATPAARVELARCALALGHPTLACETLRSLIVSGVADAQTRYLAALAHTRLGGYREASALVDSLLRQQLAPALRVDVLALAGRIAKDRWVRLPQGHERRLALACAQQHYLNAWESSGDVFPGINAATLMTLGGELEASRSLARAVRARALEGGQEEHWRQATLGEAALLLGDAEAAFTHYNNAVKAAGQRQGDVTSMRRQMRLIARHIAVPDAVCELLQAPRILVFSGHMIDAGGRDAPRFPLSLESAVAVELAHTLERLSPGFGFCSAASGADLLFIEAMLARGCEVHVTLPFEREDFIATSVAPAGEAWVARFEAVMLAVSSVSYGVRERYLGDDSLFAFAADLIQGAALLKAREMQSDPLMLAVLDPEDAPTRAGGTQATLACWQRLGLDSLRIDLAALRAKCPELLETPAPHTPLHVPLRADGLRRQLRCMLFADVVGFSRLAEEDTPAFLVNFIGAIAQILQQSEPAPAFANTWGDGLFLVFETVAQGADFALRLRDAVLDTDWTIHGLPADTGIRIGMHTGPVFPAHDPIIQRQNYFGAHVVRAARIEPVAAPGSVYVSAEMAFALAASGADGFVTEYLGVLPLAKGYGAGPLYRLRRADEVQ